MKRLIIIISWFNGIKFWNNFSYQISIWEALSSFDISDDLKAGVNKKGNWEWNHATYQRNRMDETQNPDRHGTKEDTM